MEESISGQKVVKAFRGRHQPYGLPAEQRGVFRAAVAANSYAFLLMPLTKSWETSS